MSSDYSGDFEASGYSDSFEASVLDDDYDDDSFNNTISPMGSPKSSSAKKAASPTSKAVPPAAKARRTSIHGDGGISKISRNVTATCNGKVVTISMLDLEQLVAVVDDDNNETLSVDELADLLEYIGIPNPSAKSRDLFSTIDTDKNGTITVEELFDGLSVFPKIIQAISDSHVLFEDSPRHPQAPARAKSTARTVDSIKLSAHQPIGMHVERLQEALDQARDIEKEQNRLLVDTLLRNFGDDVHALHSFIDEVYADAADYDQVVRLGRRYGVGSPGTSASEQHNDNTQGALPQGLVDHSNFRQHFEKIFGKD